MGDATRFFYLPLLRTSSVDRLDRRSAFLRKLKNAHLTPPPEESPAVRVTGELIYECENSEFFQNCFVRAALYRSIHPTGLDPGLRRIEPGFGKPAAPPPQWISHGAHGSAPRCFPGPARPGGNCAQSAHALSRSPTRAAHSLARWNGGPDTPRGFGTANNLHSCGSHRGPQL